MVLSSGSGGISDVYKRQALDGPKWLINFPTKKHWRQPSKLEWIAQGLKDLRRVVEEKAIHSIALPPLGCGNGGLDWSDVRLEITRAMTELHGVDAVSYTHLDVYKRQVQALPPA